MLQPDDVAAWIAQVRQNPEAAPDIVKALAARLVELDQQNESLRDQLVRLRRQQTAPPDSQRTIQDLKRQLEQALAARPSDTLDEATARSLLLFTLDGRGGRLPLPSLADWQERDDPSLVAGHLRPRRLLVAGESDRLLVVSDKGRVARLAVSEIDSVEPPAGYLSLVANLSLDLDESISVVLRLAGAARFGRLTLITRKGYARSFTQTELESLLERNLPLYSSPIEGDSVALVLLSEGHKELLVASRSGKGVRFPERVVGVKAEPAIRLDRGDYVVGAAVVDDETTVLALTADGVAARRQMGGFAAHATAGNKGKTLIRSPGLMALAPVAPADTLWLLTADGRLLSLPASRVPAGPGAARGIQVASDDDTLVAMTVAPTKDEPA